LVSQLYTKIFKNAIRFELDKSMYLKKEQQIVFISGLHKSGTSVLHRILGNCDEVTRFTNTSVPEDEGQHLQSVYLPAKAFGGPGKFAFHPDAYLDENSPLVCAANSQKIYAEWKKFWDSRKNILLEKSPPNLIRTRFLQALFPDAKFITILRHPVAVALATQKWSGTSFTELLQHWIKAHSIYFNDRQKLRNELLFSYEEMIERPTEIFKSIGKFLNIDIQEFDQIENKNELYFKQCQNKLYSSGSGKMNNDPDFLELEKNFLPFSYSLIDLSVFPKSKDLNL